MENWFFIIFQGPKLLHLEQATSSDATAGGEKLEITQAFHYSFLELVNCFTSTYSFLIFFCLFFLSKLNMFCFQISKGPRRVFLYSQEEKETQILVSIRKISI
jgi:hypothetical protein